jgi:hypothetical protein
MVAPLSGCDRLALRALIQIANAGLKHRMKQPRAVVRLLGDALSALRELERRRHRGRMGLADSFDAARLRDDLSKFKSTRDGFNEPPLIGLENRFLHEPKCRSTADLPWTHDLS